MIHGVIFPSSQVIGFAISGVAPAACGSRPPQTIASKAPCPPVRCTWVTSGAATAACAISAPPVTILSSPASMSGSRATLSTGLSGAWSGCSLSRTARPCSKIWQMTSAAARPVTLPAPSTTATPPDRGRSSASRRQQRSKASSPPGFTHRTVARWPRKIIPSNSAPTGMTSTSTIEAGSFTRGWPPGAAWESRGGRLGFGRPPFAISAWARAVSNKSRSVASGPVAISSARAAGPPCFIATAVWAHLSAMSATRSAEASASRARAEASRMA